MLKWIIGAVTALAALPALAAEGERIQVKGEIIDTWCYFSGVMGAPESVVGSAHHTCAIWCAAGCNFTASSFTLPVRGSFSRKREEPCGGDHVTEFTFMWYLGHEDAIVNLQR